MASTKLSAEDKQAIVELYQEVGQTAATVAEQYGVSVSTISRLLKSELSKESYDALVRQKRGGGETKSKKRTSRKKPVSKLKKAATPPEAPKATPAEPVAEIPAETIEETKVEEVFVASTVAEATEAPTRRRRRTSSSVEKKRPVSRRRKTKDPEPEPALAQEDTGAIASEVLAKDTAAPEIVAIEAAAEPEAVSAGRRKPTKRVRPRLKQAVEAENEEALVAESAVEASPEDSAEAGDDGETDVKSRRRTRRRTRPRTRLQAGAVEEISEAPEVVEVTPDDADEPVVESAEAEDLEDELVLDDLDSSDEDEDFDDAFDDEDEDDEDDEDDSSDNITSLRRRSSAEDLVQIQPLSDANLSRMLYLVIDRTADLITMPMVFFSDLGQLPAEEEEKKTLPVFENHRVARRFSQRNQRVIKVPDGELLSKTAPWLAAKGITRCLLDGQVYSLESAERPYG